MFSGLFKCSANREEPKREEPPRKNGIIRTDMPPKYEFFRDGVLPCNFEKNGSARWGYTPRVQEQWHSTIAHNATLTAEECSQIAAQLRILNEQSTTKEY